MTFNSSHVHMVQPSTCQHGKVTNTKNVPFSRNVCAASDEIELSAGFHTSRTVLAAETDLHSVVSLAIYS